ncbi:MAG: hypothetical protein ABIO86_06755 [Sphingomonas sp.]
MTPAELKALPVGTNLFWVNGTGLNEVRVAAKLVVKERHQLALYVYFPNITPQRKRWSLITNLPVGAKKGYEREVHLEL